MMRLFQAAACLMLGLLLVPVMDSAQARRRAGYNDDYLIRVSEEDSQRSLDAAVNKAMHVRVRNNAEVSGLQTRLTSLNTDRKTLTEKIIETRRKELTLTQTISAWQRQKNNNDWRVKDLEAQLQRME